MEVEICALGSMMPYMMSWVERVVLRGSRDMCYRCEELCSRKQRYGAKGGESCAWDVEIMYQGEGDFREGVLSFLSVISHRLLYLT